MKKQLNFFFFVFRIKIINYPTMDKSMKPKIFFIDHSKSLGIYFLFILSQEKVYKKTKPNVRSFCHLTEILLPMNIKALKEL